MTSEVFLDTAYTIALSVESDEHHERAEELAEQLETEATHLITTRAVLLEIGNAPSKKRYRRLAKSYRKEYFSAMNPVLFAEKMRKGEIE